jgi:hypothetical protein
VRQRFADLGQEIFPREQRTPAALYAHHKAEIEKWSPIIKAANIALRGGLSRLEIPKDDTAARTKT